MAIGIACFGVPAGMLSAMFGVGGGLVMVPFIVAILGESQHLAEGTSLLVIVPTAVMGVLAHRRRGYVSFKHAAWLAVGGVAGGFLGARLALALSEDALQVAFGIFLAVMGTGLIYQGGRALKAERMTREHGAGSAGPQT